MKNTVEPKAAEITPPPAAPIPTPEPTPAPAVQLAVTVQPETPQPVAVRRDLFNMDLFSNSPTINRVFGLEGIKAKDGSVIGAKTWVGKRKDVAAMLGLTTTKKDAAALQDAIDTEQRKAWKILKAWLLMQPDNSLGLKRYQVRDNKDGRYHTLAIKEMPEQDRIILQKLADAHGVPVEELAAFLESRKQKPAVNVTSSVSA